MYNSTIHMKQHVLDCPPSKHKELHPRLYLMSHNHYDFIDIPHLKIINIVLGSLKSKRLCQSVICFY